VFVPAKRIYTILEIFQFEGGLRTNSSENSHCKADHQTRQISR